MNYYININNRIQMNQSKGTIYFRDNAWYKMENGGHWLHELLHVCHRQTLIVLLPLLIAFIYLNI